jgi:uncharacterized coiled-coil protein SlyX
LHEFNEVLTDQQQQLGQLQQMLKKLDTELAEMMSRNQPDAASEPPPPHY